MSKQNTAAWETARPVDRRWVIEGILCLRTATHLGNGDADSILDMPLLRDEREGLPLLTGATLAGALRQVAVDLGLKTTNLLFGGERGDANGEQSALVVDDAIGDKVIPEVRDGVRIDYSTGAAMEGAKFDIQLLPRGTSFRVRFELLEPPNGNAVRQDLAACLTELANAEVGLGARKRRGFGRVSVTDWRVWEFPVTTAQGMCRWLAWDGKNNDASQSGSDIGELLGVANHTAPARDRLEITASLELAGSVLIRGYTTAADEPDAVHLRASSANGDPVPVIPGSSWGGALRHRAYRIARTLANQEETAQSFVDSLFGRDLHKHRTAPHAARLWIDESTLIGGHDLIQDRIRIDRFTGGAADTAKFDEQPYFGPATTELRLRVDRPTEADKGLLLLLLKDLATGDLPVGGTVGTGRGRLRTTDTVWRCQGDNWQWDAPQNLQPDVRNGMQGCVDALYRALQGGTT